MPRVEGVDIGAATAALSCFRFGLREHLAGETLPPMRLAQLAIALLSRAGDRPLRFVGGVLDLHPVIFEVIMGCLKGRDVSRAEGDAALAAAQLPGGKHLAWNPLLTGPLSI
ncbi:hypothetical protein [Devosia sp.]|uniref:hypothetical protein n=1 Tax=Devosia sp. TaxID=1871048 RepID=UPI002FC5E553